MGDSITQGAGIEYEKTFSGIITSYYKSYSIDVINMSAVSYSPSIHYTKFKYFVENYDLKFDKIFVIKDGELIEEGSHKNLINNSIQDAEKELSNDDIDDQKRYLLNHKVEVLKSLN